MSAKLAVLPEIILASRNAKKLAEMNRLLNPYSFSARSVSEFDDVPEVIEDGETFAENAGKKASQTASFLKRWAIGEDSGLCVDAIDGKPGVYSARFSGENATDEKNNQKLIEELKGVPDDRRSAHYVCHIALSDPEGNVCLDIESYCHGRIGHVPLGSQGFGYDPYFLIPEYHRTFGQLNPIVKQCLSHRGRAFRQFIPQLIEILNSAEAATQ